MDVRYVSGLNMNAMWFYLNKRIMRSAICDYERFVELIMSVSELMGAFWVLMQREELIIQ